MFKIEPILSGLQPFFIVSGSIAALLALLKLCQYWKYRQSCYGAVSGNGFRRTILDKENYSEFLTFRILEKMRGYNRLLTNIYIPKANGTTTEIDLLMINRAGIYVFESNNYGGWISGDEKSIHWTTSLKGDRKVRFLSPVIQNNVHIKALRKLLGRAGGHAFFSYIVFSQRCELKKIAVTSPDIFVMKRDMLYSTLREDMNRRPDILTDAQVIAFYEILRKYSLADTQTKDRHIRNIENRRNTPGK